MTILAPRNVASPRVRLMVVLQVVEAGLISNPITMVDITKCTNNDCFLAKDCYRITAADTPGNQYYQNFLPNNSDVHGVFCDHFITNEVDKE